MSIFLSQFLANNMDFDISVQEFKKTLDNKPSSTLFVDVRTTDEIKAASIEGFLHIDIIDLEQQIANIQGFNNVYFLCRSGKRSTTACIIATRHGIKNPKNIAGGILAWQEANFPIKK